MSMGVQSFDAGLLEACGRAHSLTDVYQAVEVLRKAGMDNFSIDLMRYIFPGIQCRPRFTVDEGARGVFGVGFAGFAGFACPVITR